MQRKEIGSQGEQLACNFLKKKGYRILETNYRCLYGEIDIVARHQSCLVFVEVRSRSHPGFGAPEESLTSAKVSHLENSVYHYLQHHTNLPESWRVDLVAIEMDNRNRLKRIDIIENALAD